MAWIKSKIMSKSGSKIGFSTKIYFLWIKLGPQGKEIGSIRVGFIWPNYLPACSIMLRAFWAASSSLACSSWATSDGPTLKSSPPISYFSFMYSFLVLCTVHYINYTKVYELSILIYLKLRAYRPLKMFLHMEQLGLEQRKDKRLTKPSWFKWQRN